MLLRGQNVVGYRHYADDVVEKFCQLAVKNGMDIFRIFDALNDLRNLETAIKAVKKAGGHAQGTVCYTISPVHTTDMYAKQAKQLEEMGSDSICIKDMAGLLHPYDAFDDREVDQGRRERSRSRCTATARAAWPRWPTSRPPKPASTSWTARSRPSRRAPRSRRPSRWSRRSRAPSSTRSSTSSSSRTSPDYFGDVRKKYAAFEGNVQVDSGVLLHQVPGGMISNLVSQLREQGAADKLQGGPRRDPGACAPTSATRRWSRRPARSSARQAVMNVALRRALQAGHEGDARPSSSASTARRPPRSPTTSARRSPPAQEPITGRPADAIDPELEKAKSEIGALAKSDEDVLSYVLFPQVAKEYLEWREGGEEREREDQRIAAAIAVALTHDHGRAAPQPATAGNGHAETPGAWQAASGR